MRSEDVTPASTYRVQLHRGFGFCDLEAVVPLLADLGITHVYLSPILAARPGSTHGYDICDHGRLNPELGASSDYDSLVATLRTHAMGQIVDFVPNHMGIDPAANRWWRDVLARGRASPFARTFDIEWDPIKPEAKGKILLPILGGAYGEVLERGEIRLETEDGGVRVRYFDHDLPLNGVGLAEVLAPAILAKELGDDHPAVAALHAIVAEAPVGESPRLRSLLERSATVRTHLERQLADLNGRPGDPRSFDGLHAILERQHYRLAHWKTAVHEINYRRFFDINDLAGIRVEDPEVFEATHAFLLRLVGEGKIQGIRLDHIDGLFDPEGYLERLRSRAGDAWIVVEKILCEGETLPRSWPVAGTTGYDFLNDLNGIFVDRRHAKPLRRFYARFTSRTAPFPIVTYVGKRLIMQTSMASELNVLAHALNRLSEKDRRSRDFTLETLREALREIVACFPVYRTYVNAGGADARDHATVEAAIALARRRNPAFEPSVFRFLRSVLLPEEPGEGGERLSVAMRFQQYTGPVQAKGVEDTAFYRYNALLSLNEVGGEPERFGRTVAEFHGANARRLSEWPTAMLATATHDTKRGEDARVRLNVLSEIPREWTRIVSRWARLNAGRRTRVDGEWAPDRNEEYLYYQSLLAVWPPAAGPEAAAALVERLQAYLVKALREAKLRTSWTNPNEPWEAAVTGFVERTLRGPRSGRFLDAFLPFQRRIARLGAASSLSQAALKLACPGVPDIYQGTELWDLSLVDPDNRRPVDFDLRRRILETMTAHLARKDTTEDLGEYVASLLEEWPDGRIKLWLTACGLRTRRGRHPLFLEGDYVPISCDPSAEEDVIAFLRRRKDDLLVVVASRFAAARTDDAHPFPVGPHVWGDARVLLPPGVPQEPLVDAFTGAKVTPDGSGGIPLAEAFRILPVAWLRPVR